jgi:hypothetical protein
MKAPSLPALKRGDVLDGKYVLREPIGQGGMGSVFLADQPGLGRSVAIKVLHPELARCPAHARRIRDEAMAASRVRSSHCLTVIDCSALPDGADYLVMGMSRQIARALDKAQVELSRARGEEHARLNSKILELQNQLAARRFSVDGRNRSPEDSLLADAWLPGPLDLGERVGRQRDHTPNQPSLRKAPETSARVPRGCAREWPCALLQSST